MKRFPIYRKHQEANCFNCGGEVRNPEDKGYPDGSGRYRAFCSKCSMFTYYDVKETKED